jgi:hypothetical protein
MKYHDKASYCRKCLKPCDEVTILDGDGIRTWGTWVSACCHEPDVFTRREALEYYLWCKKHELKEGKKT